MTGKATTGSTSPTPPARRALDLDLEGVPPAAPPPTSHDGVATHDARPGEPDFAWLAPYLAPAEILPLLAVARAWRDAGESPRLWAPGASRARCVRRLRERERVRRLLAEYYALLVQHRRGEVARRAAEFGTPPDPARVRVRYGAVRLEDPLEHAAAYVAEAQNQLRRAEAALAALTAPRACDGAGEELVKCFRAAIERECGNAAPPWDDLHQAPLPPGLAALLDVCAQARLLSPDPNDSARFEETKDSLSLGDLRLLTHGVTGEMRLSPAGALLLLGWNAYDDDVDWLCVEWRPDAPDGRSCRFVTFHAWDDDRLSTMNYAFSEAQPDWARRPDHEPDHSTRLRRMEEARGRQGGRGAPASLMAGEAAMARTSHCVRHAVYPGVEELLRGLIDEVRARRDLARKVPNGNKGEWSCFTCAAYGYWQNWHPEEVPFRASVAPARAAGEASRPP